MVILLLGILTATALPRFMNVTTEAHNSVVEGTLGSLKTAGALFKAQWTGTGQPTGAVLGFGDGTLFASTSGHAAGDSDDTLDSNSECVEVYNGLLQSGRATVGEVVDMGGVGFPDDADLVLAVTEGFDFLAGQNAGTCSYTYVADSARTTLNGEPRIFYNSDTGNWGIYIP